MENRINRMNAYNDLSKKSEEKSAEEKFSEMEKNDEIEAEIERIKKEKGIEKCPQYGFWQQSSLL